MARWSLLLQEYDFTLQHRAGVDNTNADCLNRFPLVSEENAPILDWSRGEIPIYLTAMAAREATAPPKKEKDIWEDKEVLHFIQTHLHIKGLTAQERDRKFVQTHEGRSIASSSAAI